MKLDNTETPTELGELHIDRLHRALVQRCGIHFEKATGEMLAESLAEAGLEDAPQHLREEALKIVVAVWKCWRAACERDMLVNIACWQPSQYYGSVVGLIK